MLLFSYQGGPLPIQRTQSIGGQVILTPTTPRTPIFGPQGGFGQPQGGFGSPAAAQGGAGAGGRVVLIKTQSNVQKNSVFVSVGSRSESPSSSADRSTPDVKDEELWKQSGVLHTWKRKSFECEMEYSRREGRGALKAKWSTPHVEDEEIWKFFCTVWSY